MAAPTAARAVQPWAPHPLNGGDSSNSAVVIESQVILP